MALAVLGTTAPASGQQRQGSGGSAGNPLFGTMRDAKDRAQRCEEARKGLQRKRVELEQKQRRAHEEWHRRNDKLNGGEWLRKHQAFHQQLQREREASERAYLKDCDEAGRRGGGARDDNRWRKDHDALERERDRFRGILGRRKNN